MRHEVTQTDEVNMSYDEKDHTSQQYLSFAEAYAFFNAKLFGNELPTCLITLTRKKGMAGYFHREKFSQADAKINELALNPSLFAKAGNEGTLQTLLHEMCHVWQFHFGVNKPTAAYHNKEFAAKMISCGLHPSNTGQPGGKEVGIIMSDYVIDGGIFQILVKEFLALGEFVLYHEKPDPEREKKKKKKYESKTKFTCDFCGQNAWAKKSAKLRCGVDGMIMEHDQEGDEDDLEEDAA